MADLTENLGKPTDNDLMQMASEIVSAYVSNNPIETAQVPELIRTVYQTLNALGHGAPAAEATHNPAIAIKKSITPDYLICLEDGKKLKMLKRHLRTVYNLTPQAYRAKWNLPPDYPMVAPNYATQRSDFAKSIGLGHSTGTKKRRRNPRG